MGKIRSFFKNVSSAISVISGNRGAYSVAELDSLMDEKVFGKPTTSYGSISPDIANNYSAWFSGRQQISQTIASLPLFLLKKDSADKRRPYLENSLFNVLRYRADGIRNAFMWKESMVHHLIDYGNSFSKIVRNDGNNIIALVLLNPRQMKIIMDSTGKIFYMYREADSKETLYDRREILHVAGFGFDGIQGYSILDLAAESIALGLAEENFQARFVGKGTHLGGIFKLPNAIQEDKKQETLEALEKKFKGVNNSFNVMILEKGYEYEEMKGMALKDAEFLESRVFQIDEIARWLNMPPHKLKNLENATYDNITSEQISYLQDTIRPWLVRIEEQLMSQLVPRKNMRTVEIEFSVEELLKTDIETLNKALEIQRRNGIITANDWRLKIGRNPIDGEVGKTFFQPVNFFAKDKDGNVTGSMENNENEEELTDGEE
jgi:HK97 family phage portal protein